MPRFWCRRRRPPRRVPGCGCWRRADDAPAFAASAGAALGLSPARLAGAARGLPVLPELLAICGGGGADSRAAARELARPAAPLALPSLRRRWAGPRAAPRAAAAHG